jgi:tetratricopeptide (TPR) repeat protein
VAQECSDQFAVTGRVLAHGVNWDQYYEILMLQEIETKAYGYTDTNGEFKLPSLPSGQYYIVVRIDGFKEYKERLTLFGCGPIYPHFVFMEFEEEPILPLLLDFSGEVREVVDIAELRRQFPRNIVNEYERARADRLRGEPEKARERLEKILKEAPEFYDARNELGTIYLEKQMFREAEEQFNAARDLRPQSAAPLVSLGSLYVQEVVGAVQGTAGIIASPSDIALMLDDARGVLQEAIKVKPDASFAHYLLAMANAQSGRIEEAEAGFKRALEIEARLRWARLALAGLYVNQRRWSEALIQYDTYLADFPKVKNRPEVQQARDAVAQRIDKPLE